MATSILESALKYRLDLDTETQQRLQKLQEWDFTQIIEDMTPRLLLLEGRLFSIEQLIPLLLHFAQEDDEIKVIAQKALLPWLGGDPYYQQASGIDYDFVEKASEKIKNIVVEIVDEFKKFVAISLIEPNQVHAPSGPVDMFWHFLILHTIDYNRFCDEVWGSHPFDKSIAA
ncbi:MAG: hypothetical protein JNK00_01680 [Flavipsychrobacter sp.]|nr:hypothetical protein [Flavipsychrobacter sp.]